MPPRDPASTPPSIGAATSTRARGGARAGRDLGRVELTAFLALSMALAALGIDLMLPALGEIRRDLGLAPGATAVTGLVTAYFLGLAAGQLVYGPLADRYGRKRALHVGYAVYGVGALAAALGPTLAAVWVARFVWGLGAAGPRVATIALIRDRYEGEEMARAMSFVMAVFILVPVVAPTLGALGAATIGWRATFGLCVVTAAAVALWARRVPETLAPEHRLPLSPARLAAAARTVVTERRTAAYTLAMTAMYGAFTSYLASSRDLFTVTFDREAAYPTIFGALALVMGVGMLANARVVRAVGPRRLSHGLLLGYLAAAGALVGVALATDGRPPFAVFVVAIAAMLLAHALLIPNLNTVAMSPMGAIAGTAAAVIGAVQIAGGALLGSLLDRTFDGTITPLAWGFLGYGLLAFALVTWAERGRLFQRLEPAAGVGPPDPVVAATVSPAAQGRPAAPGAGDEVDTPRPPQR